jgi:hypothetical protein
MYHVKSINAKNILYLSRGIINVIGAQNIIQPFGMRHFVFKIIVNYEVNKIVCVFLYVK